MAWHARRRLLDKNMFMEQLNRLAAHQLRAKNGGIRVEDELSIFGNASPVAVIDEEASAAILALVDARIRVRIRHVGGNPAAKNLDPVGKHIANDGHALLAEFPICSLLSTGVITSSCIFTLWQEMPISKGFIVSHAGPPRRVVAGGVSLAGCHWRVVTAGVSLAGCDWQDRHSLGYNQEVAL